MNARLIISYFSLILSHIFFIENIAAEPTNIRAYVKDKAEIGRVAIVKSSEAKILEFDMDGKKTWEFQIPRKYRFGPISIDSGPDIEWQKETDTFLLAIPKVGIIEVNRAGNVIWEYLTKDISHDVDLLADETLIFVNGWDADNDYIFTRVNRRGEVIERYTAEQIGLNRADRFWNDNIPGRTPEPYSNTHANAIQSLGNGKYLLSLRNYHRAVVIENGKIIKSYGKAKLIHDPIDVDEKIFFVRMEKLGESRIVMIDKKSGKRSRVFDSPNELWTPMRSLEILKNENFLVTGSAVIAQVSPSGEIIWQLDLINFQHQVLGSSRVKDFVFKATFVYK